MGPNKVEDLAIGGCITSETCDTGEMGGYIKPAEDLRILLEGMFEPEGGR